MSGETNQLRHSWVALLGVLGLVLGVMTVVAAPARAATGGYPNYNAQIIPETTYEWWVDENGNGIRDWTPAVGDDDEAMSPRLYYYRNCTDYVAWKLEQAGVARTLWQGNGNASQWDDRNPTRVTATPKPGMAAVHALSKWGHLSFVEEVHGDGTITISDYNRNGHGNYRKARVTPSDESIVNYVDFGATAVQPVKDGDFISYGVDVYRIAGGAPVYVSTWVNVGGQPSTVRAVSASEWNALRQYPRNGTYIRGVAPGSGDHGSIYRVAGGAPIYVQDPSRLGGEWGTPVDVDLAAIHSAGTGGRWDHLRQRPTDGTRLTASGNTYTTVGGAPILQGPGTTGTLVDYAAISNAGKPGVWSHLAAPPPTDSSAPETSISSGPSGTVTTRSVSFGFRSSESGSSFECRLDGGSWSKCSSPKEFSGLVNGGHSFLVRATDKAGNTDASPASRSFTVDVPVSAMCRASDISRDGDVGIVDLSVLLTDWGSDRSRSDLNTSGKVDIVDLSILLSNWECGSVGAAGFGAQALSASADGVGDVTVLPGASSGFEAVAGSPGGVIGGNALDASGKNRAGVVWKSATADPVTFTVPGAKGLEMQAVNDAGMAVGIGESSASNSDGVAWYRTPAGTVGLFKLDGADSGFASDVNATGVTVGFLFKNGKAQPVVWDTVGAAPRYLPVQGAAGGVADSVNAAGAVVGTLSDDRMVVWGKDGTGTVVLPDGQAVDMNRAGDVVFVSPSNRDQAARVRKASGAVHKLLIPSGVTGRVRAQAISDAGLVAGSTGVSPVVWLSTGKAGTVLNLPGRAGSGVVTHVSTAGAAFGFIDTSGGRQAVGWSDYVAPPPVVKPPAPTRVVVKAKAVKHRSKLRVDVNPNQRAWNYKIKVQKKVRGKWKTVKVTRTKGVKDKRTINLRKGKYRVKVPSQHGLKGNKSNTIRLRR